MSALGNGPTGVKIVRNLEESEDATLEVEKLQEKLEQTERWLKFYKEASEEKDMIIRGFHKLLKQIASNPL